MNSCRPLLSEVASAMQLRKLLIKTLKTLTRRGLLYIGRIFSIKSSFQLPELMHVENDKCIDKLEMFSVEYGEINFSTLDTPKSIAEKHDSSLVASGEFGSIAIKEIFDDDYNIWRCDFNIKTDTRIVVKAIDKPSIALTFTLKKDIHYKLKGFSENVSRKHQYSFIYIPSIECEYQFAKGEYSICGIQFSLAFLERWKHSFPMLTDFVNKIDGSAPVSIAQKSPYATLEMIELMGDLQQCGYPRIQRKMFLEAKILELLLLSLQQLTLMDETLPLRKSDMEKIMEVVEFLTQHFEEHITMDSLVHKFGLNEYKLKTGFKYYGTTVFSYIQRLRLQKAKQLLNETDWPMKKIAMQTGYSTLQYFSSAFKKEFGVSPGRLKQGKPAKDM